MSSSSFRKKTVGLGPTGYAMSMLHILGAKNDNSILLVHLILYGTALLEKFTTNTAHRQTVGFSGVSRVSRVSRVRVRIRVSVTIRVRFSCMVRI